jgi:putative phage-type endonuclease
MDKRVEELIKRPQLKQLSKEWFEARPSLITASSAASLLKRDKKTCAPYIKAYNLEDIFDVNGKCCNPYSSKNSYFLERCNGSTFKGSAATYWGQKYESVACDIYSNLNSKEVLEFGLLVHPEHNWLAASPDGITPCGIMVEIKCPYRRKITGIPPFYYWIQCQLQLEVCNLDYCDFSEFEFIEYKTEEEWLDDTTLEFGDLKFKGLFIQEGDCGPENLKYIYPPKDILCDEKKLIDWAKENSSDLRTLIYWKIYNYSITRINREKFWFNDVLPDFSKEWKLLAFYKKGDNYKHLTSSLNKDEVCSSKKEIKCFLIE